MRPAAIAILLIGTLAPSGARALNQPNGTTIPTPILQCANAGNNTPGGLAAVLACACTQPNVCNIGPPCPSQSTCDNGQHGTCETTVWHNFNDNTCIPSNVSGLDLQKEAKTTPETFRPTCPLTFTVLSRGNAMFKNAFGWYNVRPNQAPDPNDLHAILDCNSAPGTAKVLDLKSEPTYKGGEVGFFLVTPEGHPATKGCAGGDCCASVSRVNGQQQGYVYFSERKYNPDQMGMSSYIHLLVYDSRIISRKFYFAWEDLYGGADNEFTDLVTSVEGVECSGAGTECSTGKKGVCALGVTHCVSGANQCEPLYQSSTERCDGLDNDCDGVIDNGAMCDTALVCWNGECVPHCDSAEFACASDQECDPKSGLCVDPRCPNVNCPADKICRAGQCVAACDGITCPHGQTCRLGNCIDPCKGVTCGPNLVCAEGFCVPGCGRCDGLTCATGLSCEMTTGECKDPSCPNGCTAGTYCVNGTCKDACDGAVCPRNQRCEDGQCVFIPLSGSDGGPTYDVDGGLPFDASAPYMGSAHNAGCDCAVGGSGRANRSLAALTILCLGLLLLLRTRR